jgi:hypothetical protein
MQADEAHRAERLPLADAHQPRTAHELARERAVEQQPGHEEQDAGHDAQHVRVRSTNTMRLGSATDEHIQSSRPRATSWSRSPGGQWSRL